MIRRIGLLLLALTMLCGAARAQTLPSNAVFSPGLLRMAALEKTQPSVEAQASVDVNGAMYARDLSVLGAMLEGTTIAYRRGAEGETLTLLREGETLGAYALPSNAQMDALEARLLGVPALERVPLADVADWLEGLQAGDALAFGFTVSEPFVLERTNSDDGTRLTKITVSGAIARAGEAPYRVEGFLRQPAGRAPKDTFELTFRQDEDNFVELLYSALRESEVTRRDAAGTVSVRTVLKAAGRIAGSGVSSRLTVNMKNDWTVDGDALGERVTVTANLTHQDGTPGRRMQRLNDVAAQMRHTIRLKTREGDGQIALTDEMTVQVTLDGNTFLDAGADVALRVGGEAPAAGENPEPIDAARIETLAQKIYRQLDGETLETIRKGL